MGRYKWGFGEILSLVEACEDLEFRSALEYDLLALGFRLRWVDQPEQDFSWKDVLVIVSQSPRLSALMRKVDPDLYHWGLQEHLTAALVDAVRGISWQLGGGKGKRPDPIPQGSGGRLAQSTEYSCDDTPNAGIDPLTSVEVSGTITGVAVSIDELNKFLGW